MVGTAYVAPEPGAKPFIEVGAMMVGKIVQTHDEEQPFARGAEKGYFLFGTAPVGGGPAFVCGGGMRRRFRTSTQAPMRDEGGRASTEEQEHRRGGHVIAAAAAAVPQRDRRAERRARMARLQGTTGTMT